MKIVMRPVILVAGLAALPLVLLDHFKLLEPAEWVKTNELGDPQKMGPCGGDPRGNGSLLINASTKISGGSKLYLKIQETVFHSGHYRVALAVNSRTDLPPDPVVTERWTEVGPFSTWAQVQSPPQIQYSLTACFRTTPNRASRRRNGSIRTQCCR